ncbi:hypothetical protein ACGFYZ_40955 [Streptomyces sp. NPDC048330]|uniref:hypothetical protein n=1 Tax=Streptomyces sp. NPDC048330 TaxID=3365533 RepID=UPI003715C2C6
MTAELTGAYWLDSPLHDSDDCVWCAQLREAPVEQEAESVPPMSRVSAPWMWWPQTRRTVMPAVSSATVTVAVVTGVWRGLQ